MRKILDDPKTFFNSLSTAEFDKLLNDFGFEYEIEDENIEEKYYAYSSITSSKKILFKEFRFINSCLNNKNNVNRFVLSCKNDKYIDDKILENFIKEDTSNCTANNYIVDKHDNDFAKAA